MFKAKSPKRYIQVKTSIINCGTSLIAICSDISRIKELEVQSTKMRSIFFSSVAHELRTPLNSIIPMVRMILESMVDQIGPRIQNYLSIVLNSSLHL